MLSIEARAFLDRPAGPTIELTRDSIALRRSTNRERYRARSKRAIKTHGVEIKEISLGGISCLDARRIDGASDFIIFFCFGGAMVSGSPFEDLPIIAALANFAWARVISPSYRLAPEFPYPQGLDDVVAAYRALCQMVDVRKIAVAGESAGGNLATSLVQRLAPTEHPRALALLSPWCDLTLSGESIAFNDRRDPTLTTNYLRQAVRLYLENPTSLSEVSPLFVPFSQDFPPTLITTGTRDLLMSDSVRLAQKLNDAGASVKLRVWDELWHVFEFYDEIPEASRSLKEIAQFLKNSLAVCLP